MLELARRGDEVVGVDCINSYYDVRLKYGRLGECGIKQSDAEREHKPAVSSRFPNMQFVRMAIDDAAAMNTLFEQHRFDKVVNLAAQAGVRYSIENPHAYVQSNVVGFLNVLECCRHYGVGHLVFASSSSVYGLGNKVPYSEDDMVDTPVSLYAATKKSNELMAHCYSKLYGFATTGLRYFTVYGPWGRPDMAPMLFADAITHGREIKVYNGGDMIRDFTYIDDIVGGTLKVIDSTVVAPECRNGVPHEVYNIGCSHPVKLMDFIAELEQAVGAEARKVFLPMQPGDVYQTNADTTKLETKLGYKPSVTLHEGIIKFVEWYKSDMNPLK